MTSREVRVAWIARVEGEGALRLRWDGDDLVDVELRIFEPPRFFEGFLRGRSALEAPDLTARICGICPAAYQLTACAAVEDALGVVVLPEHVALRRLLYCGEWIESHVLHMVMLHAPDFLGVDDVAGLARLHPGPVRDALRLKKAGNAVMATLGGREIHPINVRVGGFWRLPDRERLAELADELEACRPGLLGLLRWLGSFDVPELHRQVATLAVAPDDGYPLLGRAVVASTGLRFAPDAFEAHVVEEQAPWSHALHARLLGATYLTGPLARFELGFDRLGDDVRALAQELGVLPPVTNPFRALLVRGLEVLHALDTAVALARSTPVDGPPSVPVILRAGTGTGVTEAPRGLLFHRYDLDDEGTITAAHIVPPTSQNQLAIEADLRALGPDLRAADDAGAARLAERAVRNHDPCISCSTHFLRVQREGA